MFSSVKPYMIYESPWSKEAFATDCTQGERTQETFLSGVSDCASEQPGLSAG